MSGIMGVGGTSVNKAILRDRDGSVVGTMTYRKSGTGKKKSLRYSFKRISAQILSSKTSGVARRVVTKARHEVVNLLRKKNGGYDEEELRHALIHAERMVRVAKKRMRHLQEEEDAKKKGGICEAEVAEKTEEASSSTEERLMEDLGGEEILSQEEMKKLMQELEDIMKELEESNGLDLEELMPISSEEMDPADLELLKKKHRAQEMRDIMEADMKYLKAMFNKLERERQEGLDSIKCGDYGAANGPSNGSSNGVSLELGGVVAAQNAQPLTQITVMTEGGSIDISL